ncbi:MAG: tRNA glutamyl-Q(34) synthetase GluQRS [Phycisphaeraceae bacterium]
MTHARTHHHGVTRLAPSPTGALHLGNARTFLINWALARRAGQRIVLRIEDLDGPRVKAAAGEQAIEMLRWLGMDWDGEPVWQSADFEPYRDALEVLSRKRLIYPCRCTRREIEQAQSAPHGDEHELRYPGTCRGESFKFQVPGSRLLEADETTAWRVCVPDEPITFHDALHGEQTVNVQQQVGDFVVATKNGMPAYQLAVVVDDARQGVTEVVRGDDLLGSTARQLWLYRMLELTPLPRYVHVPLVLGPDGRRLAKRHGDTRLVRYREAGVPAERVIGLLAWWSGAASEREMMAAATFAERFTLDRLPRAPVTFTEEDETWLVGS